MCEMSPLSPPLLSEGCDFAIPAHNACSQSKHRLLEAALGRAAARGWQPTSSGTSSLPSSPAGHACVSRRLSQPYPCGRELGFHLHVKPPARATFPQLGVQTHLLEHQYLRVKRLHQTIPRPLASPAAAPSFPQGHWKLVFSPSASKGVSQTVCPCQSARPAASWGWDYCHAPSTSQAVGLSIYKAAPAKDTTAKQEIG